MDWQTFTAMFAVLVAAAWLLWRCWRFFQRAMSGGKIGDCGHCPKSSGESPSTTLVQLGSVSGRTQDLGPTDHLGPLEAKDAKD